MKLICPNCKNGLFINVFTIESVSPFSQISVHTKARHVTRGMVACLNCLVNNRKDVKVYLNFEAIEEDMKFEKVKDAVEKDKENDRHNDNGDKKTGDSKPNLKILH